VPGGRGSGSPASDEPPRSERAPGSERAASPTVTEDADAFLEERLAANRRNWDERVGVHLGSRFYDVERWLANRPGPRQRETEVLGDVAGLELVHLQCHFGLDTLAWADAGARVTGLDFSPAAIEAATELAARAGLDGRSSFVCASVDDAVDVLGPRRFDIVYVSLGALIWLPSVGRWADQVASLAKPGGRLYLHEIHPLSWSLAESLSDGRPTIAHPYFEQPEPYADDSGETYTDADRALVNTRTYEWNHSIGEVVTALVDRGMRIDRLEEHDWTVDRQFEWLDEVSPHLWTPRPGLPRVPLTYTVAATKN
jgi:SAM-dependent methyltransferase